jgi:hypothetical protein
VKRSLLEAHHAAGEANDPDVLVVLCMNCHRVATEGQLDVGALPAGRAPTFLERLALTLRSLGTFFSLLAERCFAWATQLGHVVALLDEQLPTWRLLGGMP